MKPGELTYEDLLARIRNAEELLADSPADPLQEVTGALRAARTSLEQLFGQRTEDLQRLGTAIECAAESILITSADGTIGYVNPAFEEVTGYTRAEVLGRQPNILKSGRHDDAFYRTMWETLLAGNVWQGRITNRKKDGSLFEEAATISPIRDSNGAITGFVGVKRDITRELQLEAQLLQAQKMEAVGRLAGGVAHDFNNLLTVINGYTDLVLAKLPSVDPNRGHLAEVRTAGERAAALTRQLLAFSRRQNVRPQLLDLNTVVEAAARMFTRMTGGQSSVTLHLEDGPLPVLADEGQLDQVLMNLVTNALDAMPSGGTIEIATAKVDTPVPGLHRRTAPGGLARLAVSDTGQGMDKETLSHIFEPFFTTKEVGKGTGLGLPTVQGIVDQSGGWIEVHSEIGRGTRFEIFLPLAAHGRGPKGKASRPSPSQTGGLETVLLVDDQQDVRRFASTVLRSYGYEVLEADGSDDAIKQEREWQGKIHLLLTDLMMPGMNGRELATVLRQRRPDIKVIYLSGHPAELLAQAANNPADDLIHKPFTPESLAARVRKTLGSEK
ncbi:MAG: PAS domain S-box protein [Bryobacterales bacterium]|nr:PAS domain S-box protein [Bryobacterales bacterium]